MTRDTPVKLTKRQQRIYDFLVEHPVGVLSTVTPSGEPHGVVIYFVVDTNFGISFLTRTHTKKHDNMRYNKHVMLTAGELASQTTIQITGIANELRDSYDINRIAGATATISNKTAKTPLIPVAKLTVGEYVAYRIEPVQIHMAVYGKAGPGEVIQVFESVESFDLDVI